MTSWPKGTVLPFRPLRHHSPSPPPTKHPRPHITYKLSNTGVISHTPHETTMGRLNGIRRRKFYKRRGLSRRRPRRMYKRVKRVEKRVQRIASTIETKFTNKFNTGVSITSAGVLIQPFGETWWNQVSQSVGGTGRIGLQIRCSKITFNMQISGASSYFDSVRLICVKWKQLPPNIAVGSVPGIGYVLDNSGGIPLLVAPWVYQWRDYFRVLYDKTFLLGNNANEVKPYGCPPRRYKLKTFRLKFITTFQSASAAEIIRNGIMWYACSDSSAPPHVVMNLSSHMTYQDA